MAAPSDRHDTELPAPRAATAHGPTGSRPDGPPDESRSAYARRDPARPDAARPDAAGAGATDPGAPPGPDVLAAIHARAFVAPPPWSAATFAALLRAGDVACSGDARAFVLARRVLDEAEILTLATDPAHRRKGLARALVTALAAGLAAQGVARLHLEVACDNTAARALYDGLGFVETGRRPGYFRDPDGTRRDALLLSLPLGPVPKSG